MKNNFISRLLKRKKANYVYGGNMDVFKSCSNIEEFTKQFLNLFPCHQFAVIHDKDKFQDCSFSKELINYLASLSRSLIFISSKNKPLMSGHYDSGCIESKMNLEKRMLIISSPYHPLVFCNCKNHQNTGSSSIDPPVIETNQTVFPLNGHYRTYMPLNYYHYMSHVAYALRNTIQFCPYCIYIRLPVNPQKLDGTFDKRKNKDAYHDFGEYMNDQGQYTIDLDKDELSMPLKLFTPEVQCIFLKLGGPFIKEYLCSLNNITYKNDKITNKNTITSFFVKSYQNYVSNYYDGLKDDIKSDEILFNHFSFEAILNGSFFMYFCEFFSSSINFVPKLKKIFPQSDYTTILADLYKKINHIENPFLKCAFLDKVVYPSFFHSYKYNNNIQSAGKDNFAIWKNDIYKYIDNLIIMEQKLYKTYISMASGKIDEPSPELLAKEYLSLYEKSGIYSQSNRKRKHKRGIVYSELLPQIAIANYEYYRHQYIKKFFRP